MHPHRPGLALGLAAVATTTVTILSPTAAAAPDRVVPTVPAHGPERVLRPDVEPDRVGVDALDEPDRSPRTVRRRPFLAVLNRVGADRPRRPRGEEDPDRLPGVSAP